MFIRDTRLQIAFTLGVIAIFSLVRFFSFNILFTLIITLLIGQLVEALLSFITKKKFFLSYSALVSAFLVFLLLDYHLPLWINILAITLAISSKYIIRFKNRHIFNPAAFGLIITSILTKQQISWWGTSWNPLLAVILYIGALPVLRRLRRLYIVAGFLLVYFLFSFIVNRNLQTIQFLLDGTLMLFTLIMLPEPQTSPVMGYWQKIFGVFVGFIMILIVKFLSNLNTDPLLLSLLLADLLSFLLINIKSSHNISPVASKNV